MSNLDSEKRIEAGVREVCALAVDMDIEEAEEFFRAIAYQACDRFRQMTLLRATLKIENRKAAR